MRLLGEPSHTTFHRRFRWLDKTGRHMTIPNDWALCVLLGKLSVHFTEQPLARSK